MHFVKCLFALEKSQIEGTNRGTCLESIKPLLPRCWLCIYMKLSHLGSDRRSILLKTRKIGRVAWNARPLAAQRARSGRFRLLWEAKAELPPHLEDRLPALADERGVLGECGDQERHGDGLSLIHI